MPTLHAATPDKNLSVPPPSKPRRPESSGYEARRRSDENSGRSRNHEDDDYQFRRRGPGARVGGEAPGGRIAVHHPTPSAEAPTKGKGETRGRGAGMPYDDDRGGRRNGHD